MVKLTLLLSIKNKLSQNKKLVVVSFIIAIALFITLKPQQFANLWLTPDQQGQLLFQLGDYQGASQHFTHVQWQAYSSYGAEQYKNAAVLYSQFTDINSKLAQANALAHQRDYVKARNIYQAIIKIDADNITEKNSLAAKNNIAIVQAIIDETNLLSASQQPEEGESSKELGDDEPQAADGAEREVARKQKIEQLSSEQLLLDPALNKMWLRQVQKDPARFLAQKFYMQLEKKKNKTAETINDSQQ